MQFLAMSDIHVEFHRDKGKSFLRSLDTPEEVDAILIAGDLGNYPVLANAVGWLCEKGPRIILVAGNHDFYFSSFKKTRELYKSLEEKHENFTFLDNSSTEVEGVAIHGTTLWFPGGPQNERYSRGLNDFDVIQNFRQHVYKEHKKAKKFLWDVVKKGDVVLTHHAPSAKSIRPRYGASNMNCFYFAAMDQLIHEVQPLFWIHGHMHTHNGYYIQKTGVYCNAFGYFGREDCNRTFREREIFAV